MLMDGGGICPESKPRLHCNGQLLQPTRSLQKRGGQNSSTIPFPPPLPVSLNDRFVHNYLTAATCLFISVCG